MAQKLRGPFSYQTWKAHLSGKPWEIIREYPLFSDANFTSKEIITGFGPFQLINNIHMSSTRPAITLRVEEYLQSDLPDMNKTQDEHYHGGYEADEIAALLSLCLGVRMKAGGPSRVFSRDGDPMGIPIGHNVHGEDPTPPKRPFRPILNTALGDHSLGDANILSFFPLLIYKNAIALVRAARMYQEAVWIIDATPELSWLMLTSAVETVAQQWKEETETPVERMHISKPKLEPVLRQYAKEGQQDQLVLEVANIISGFIGVSDKFRDFILGFLPPPPIARPPVWAQVTWEKPSIKETLNTIYDYRSKALHAGKPFPGPMCQPPDRVGENGDLSEIPIGLSTGMKGSVWVAKDTPILLHTFEYIARNTILNWWKSTVKFDQKR